MICPICQLEAYSEQYVRDHAVECHHIPNDFQRGIERKRKRGMSYHEIIAESEIERIYQEFFTLFGGVR